MNAGVILFLIFAVCVAIGVPISMSLGIGSLAAVALGNLGVSPAVIAQRVFDGLQSTSIMAIAFFILAGNLMAGGGISRRIVNFANCLIGNIRGGMSVALPLLPWWPSAPCCMQIWSSRATLRTALPVCWSLPAAWAR